MPALAPMDSPHRVSALESAYRVAIWFVSRSEQLSEKQSKYLAEVCQQAEEIRKARDLTGEFCSMLRTLKGERLDEWMAKVEGSGVVELQRFALSLKKDLDAVRAGLTLGFSQGQTEGQVNKLKLLKRQSYGRAGFVLLRKRVLEAA